MKLFPTYSEVVRVVFGQVLSNHLFEELDNSVKLRSHSEFVNAIKTLIPNSDKIEFELNQFTALARVEIKVEGDFPYVIRVEAEVETQELRVYVI